MLRALSQLQELYKRGPKFLFFYFLNFFFKYVQYICTQFFFQLCFEMFLLQIFQKISCKIPAEACSHLKKPLFCNRAEFLLIFSAAQAPIKNWPTANFSREPEQLRKSIGTNIRVDVSLPSA